MDASTGFEFSLGAGLTHFQHEGLGLTVCGVTLGT